MSKGGGRPGRWALRGIGLALLAAALGLRLYRLEAQSLWYDEGASARLSEGPLRRILEGAAQDIHPPLYYLLLHAWMGAAGRSVFAMRALSAMGGVLLVAAIGALAGRWFGRQAGLWAMALMAVHPFAVYYAQEVRMYTLLGLWAALHTLFWWTWLRRPRPRVALALLLTGLAGWYTHYVFPAVPAAHFLVTAGGVGRRRRLRRLLRWLGLQAWIGLLFLPWAPVAIEQLRRWPAPAPAPIPQALWTILRTLGAGLTLPPEVPSGLFFLPWAVVGLAWLRLQDRREALGAALLLLISPIALVLARGGYREPNLKFFMASLPAFAALWAGGMTALGRGARIGPLGMALGVALTAFPLSISLRALYMDPRFARDDYRGLARSLAALIRPDDGILLYAPGQADVFGYYWPDAPLVPAPASRPLDEEEIERTLTPALAGRARLFVIWYGEREADPAGHLEAWLDARGFRAAEQWVGRLRFVVYGLGTPRPGPDPGVRFGEAIAVEAYGLTTTRLHPGDVLGLQIRWRALAPIPIRYKVFVHLVGPEGRPVAQTDREPVGWRRPTVTWRPGESLEDRYGVWLPPGLAPGSYRLTLGLYGPDGARLPAFQGSVPLGDAWTVAVIQVAPAPEDAAPR